MHCDRLAVREKKSIFWIIEFDFRTIGELAPKSGGTFKKIGAIGRYFLNQDCDSESYHITH